MTIEAIRESFREHICRTDGQLTEAEISDLKLVLEILESKPNASINWLRSLSYEQLYHQLSDHHPTPFTAIVLDRLCWPDKKTKRFSVEAVKHVPHNMVKFNPSRDQLAKRPGTF